jgi:hypothetical protein
VLLLDLSIDLTTELLGRAMGGELRPTLPLAAPGARLYAVDCRKAVDFTEEDARAYCAELAAAGVWTILHGLEEVIGPERVFPLLEVLCDEIAGGAMPPMAVVVPAASFTMVISAAPRFAGLARIIDRSTGRSGFTELNVLRIKTRNQGDTGWYVVVRLVLHSDVGDDHSVGGQAASDALGLTNGEFQVLASDARRPDGVLVRFRPDALAVDEEDPAFRAAELVSRRLVGRPVIGGEVVEAVRAVAVY